MDPKPILTTAGTDHGDHLDADGPVAKGAGRDQVRKEMPMLPQFSSLTLTCSNRPDLWQSRVTARGSRPPVQGSAKLL